MAILGHCQGGIPGAEQPDFHPPGGEPPDEAGHHQLGAAVSHGRHRNPGGAIWATRISRLPG